MRGYSALYHYVIVPNGWGDVVDIDGTVAKSLRNPAKDLWVADVDLDRTFVHTDYNGDKVAKLLSDHAGDVVDEAETEPLYKESNFHLLSRTEAGAQKGISVRALLEQYDIESLRDYQIRSRQVINRARQNNGLV